MPSYPTVRNNPRVNHVQMRTSRHTGQKKNTQVKKKADTMRKKGGQPKKLHISINRVRVTEQQGVRDEDGMVGVRRGRNQLMRALR